jgi:predicted acetyltransferase
VLPGSRGGMFGMSLRVRQLSAEDAPALWRLGREAFGLPRVEPDGPPALDRPGVVYFGAFDGSSLVACALDRSYESYFAGVAVPTSGIAGVTVAAEHRGRGALTPLLAEVLAYGRSRGALISTLYPSAPRIYRRFGYEIVACAETVEVPSHVLAAVPRASSVRARRAEIADVPAIRSIYDTWARAQNGPLTRKGPSFPATPEDHLGSFTGVSVVEDGKGAVVGFAAWDRGHGHGEDGVIRVRDLAALSGDGYRTLLATVGSFASIAATVRIETSGSELARLFVPSLHWRVVLSEPYMLRILDVPGAFRARQYPPGLSAELAFQVVDSFLPDPQQDYLLQVADGRAVCGPGTDTSTGPSFTPQGLALLYAGAQSCANLRFTGHLQGGQPAQDLLWDALFGGRQQHIRDHF